MELRRIEHDGEFFHFYGSITTRDFPGCHIVTFDYAPKRKKEDFRKAVSEVKTQEDLESLLGSTIYPCFVDGKCVGYKFRRPRYKVKVVRDSDKTESKL